MGDNSVSNNKAGEVKIIRSAEDINSLKNINDKTKSFINSAFEELDYANGAPDGKLERSEGEIHIFEDGAVSVVRDGKLIAGMSAQGAEARVVGDMLQIKFSDGVESVMKGDKLISGKTSNNRTFKKIGNEIVFEDVKKDEKRQDTAKIEDATSKRVSTGSINGVKKQKIDAIAEEFNQIKCKDGGFNKEDFDNWVKQRAEFNKKHQRTFKKILGEPEPFKNGDVNTDVYYLNFSPVLDTETMKYFWELYNAEELK